MVAAERKASLGRRWIRTGEVVGQCGHGQGPEDEEASCHHEGGYVVACFVPQEPWRGVKKQQLSSANAKSSCQDACNAKVHVSY